MQKKNSQRNEDLGQAGKEKHNLGFLVLEKFAIWSFFCGWWEYLQMRYRDQTHKYMEVGCFFVVVGILY